MLEWFAITCSATRLGIEAQNAAAFRLLRAVAGVSKTTMSDEVIREEIALISEESPAALVPIPEKSPVPIAPKRPPAVTKVAHKKSATVKRGKH